MGIACEMTQIRSIVWTGGDWLAVRGSSRAFSLDFYASVEGSQGSQSEYPMPLGLGVKQEADRLIKYFWKEIALFISFPVNENLSLGQPFSLTKSLGSSLLSHPNIDDRAFGSIKDRKHRGAKEDVMALGGKNSLLCSYCQLQSFDQRAILLKPFSY